MDEISAFVKKSASKPDVKVDLWAESSKVIPAILDEFYAGLSAVPGFRQHLAVPGQIDRLKKAQAEHWRALFAPVLPEDAVDRSTRIGEVHVKIDLPSGWYMAGYAFLLKKLLPHIAKRHRFSAGTQIAMMDTLIERVFTDMILSNTAYENRVDSDRAITAAADADLGNLRNAAGMVSDANVTAIQLAHLTRNTRLVNSSSQSISAAAAELVASVDEIARSSQSASSDAAETDATVSFGRNAVDEVSTAIANIAEAVAETATNVDELAKASDQIGQILTVIEGIAGQTNLLALNATIEAARAGEAGRGFAVVATEVKNLAGQTARSTEDINQRIAALRAGMSDILATMERSTTAVGEGRTAIARAAETMETIAGQVGNVAHKMGEISTILTQQKGATAEIAESVDRVAGIAETNETVIHTMAEKIRANNDRFGNLAKNWFHADSDRSLCEMAKVDHVFFKKRVVDTVVGRDTWKVDEVPDHHHCRLGKWYDALQRPEFKALPAYARLVEPHKRVHAAGKAALAAHFAGKTDAAYEAMDQLNDASIEVLELLEELSVGIGDIERKTERRGDQRETVSMDAEVTIGSETRKVKVSDLSAGGARIEGLRSHEVGETMRLRLADGRCCSACATWVEGGSGGVRFLAEAAE
jgi:methyl-accepting chemotaxis protein